MIHGTVKPSFWGEISESFTVLSAWIFSFFFFFTFAKNAITAIFVFGILMNK